MIWLVLYLLIAMSWVVPLYTLCERLDRDPFLAFIGFIPGAGVILLWFLAFGRR